MMENKKKRKQSSLSSLFVQKEKRKVSYTTVLYTLIIIYVLFLSVMRFIQQSNSY